MRRCLATLLMSLDEVFQDRQRMGEHRQIVIVLRIHRKFENMRRKHAEPVAVFVVIAQLVAGLGFCQLQLDPLPSLQSVSPLVQEAHAAVTYRRINVLFLRSIRPSIGN